MKKALIVTLLLVLGANYFFAYAKNDDTTIKYYHGFVETKHLPSSQTFPKQEIALKKIVDMKNQKITEIACAPFGPTPDAQYGISSIYMTINESILKIADNKDMTSSNVQGTGTVFGENWVNLTFDMKTQFGGNISWVKDVNFIVDDFLYGTKYIFTNEGSESEPKMKSEAELLMSFKMKEISGEDFLKISSDKGCSIE